MTRRHAGNHTMKRIIFLVLGIVAMLAGLAYYFFYTTPGSSLMARLVITHYVKPGRLAIQRAAGSLSEGLGLRGVQLGELAGAPKDSSLGIQQIDLAPLSVPLAQPLHVEVRDVRLQPTAMAREITIARIDGELAGDFVFYDMLLQDPAQFPVGSTVKIERLGAALPLRLQHIKAIHNGMLRLPDADPILFYGTQQDGHLEAHVYAHTVDFDRLLRMVSNNSTLGGVKAELTDMVLVITGSVDDVKVIGNFELSRLWREGFNISGCPAKLALTVKDVTTAPKVHGTVTVLGGTLTARQTVVAIQQGHVNFAGGPTAPTFDVKGISKIGDTKIFITLKGDLDKPDLQLSSDPPKPPGLLLVMLATGKPWKGAQDTLTQGTIPLDLAADFIDYFAFGGMGGKLAKRFGLTDLAVRVNKQANTVGVQTTVADRLSIGVETQPAAFAKPTAPTSETPAQAPVIPVKVGAEYKVSDTTSLQLEGERTPIQQRNVTGSSSQESLTGTAPQTNDQVLLKIKKRF